MTTTKQKSGRFPPPYLSLKPAIISVVIGIIVPAITYTILLVTINVTSDRWSRALCFPEVVISSKSSGDGDSRTVVCYTKTWIVSTEAKLIVKNNERTRNNK